LLVFPQAHNRARYTKKNLFSSLQIIFFCGIVSACVPPMDGGHKKGVKNMQINLTLADLSRDEVFDLFEKLFPGTKQAPPPPPAAVELPPPPAPPATVELPPPPAPPAAVERPVVSWGPDPALAPPPVCPLPPVQTAAEDLDVNGVAWDPELHAGNKSKNKDGSWRNRRNTGGGTAAPAAPATPQAAPAAPTARVLTAKDLIDRAVKKYGGEAVTAITNCLRQVTQDDTADLRLLNVRPDLAEVVAAMILG
jgi:hypothetical protein